MPDDTNGRSVGSSHSLKSVKLRCPECGATHHRPERVSSEDPPDTLEKTCLGSHPAREVDFEGCGEILALEVVEVKELD